MVGGTRNASRSGQSLEMAGTLMRIASAYAQTGKETEAVELLASVLADPSAEKARLAEETTVANTAQQLLDQLKGSVDAVSFEETRLRVFPGPSLT